MDDELLDEDEIGEVGAPSLLDDEDGEVGVVPEEEEDEMDGMSIKGADGEEVEDEF